MLDDMEESRSQHSIGIVENPLYAEDEAGPTYAGLTAREKESEVRITIMHSHTMKLGCYSIVILFAGSDGDCSRERPSLLYQFRSS
jgi:hypothetical protein